MLIDRAIGVLFHFSVIKEIRMKKIVIAAFLCCFFTNTGFSENRDSYCEEKFEYFDSLLVKNKTAWDVVPSLQTASKSKLLFVKRIVAENCGLNIDVDILISKEGIPKCYRYHPEVSPEMECLLKTKLSRLKFNAAKKKNYNVESVYLLHLW